MKDLMECIGVLVALAIMLMMWSLPVLAFIALIKFIF